MVPDEIRALIQAALRDGGARFAFVFGSQADGTAGDGSDIDVAAWFGSRAVASWEVPGLPAGVDLLVLDDAPLELAGRVAMWGELLFDDDPPARVNWQATTRRIWLDERPLVEQSRRDFVEGARRRAIPHG